MTFSLPLAGGIESDRPVEARFHQNDGFVGLRYNGRHG
jgi:hypothetical protein